MSQRWRKFTSSRASPGQLTAVLAALFHLNTSEAASLSKPSSLFGIQRCRDVGFSSLDLPAQCHYPTPLSRHLDSISAPISIYRFFLYFILTPYSSLLAIYRQKANPRPHIYSTPTNNVQQPHHGPHLRGPHRRIHPSDPQSYQMHLSPLHLQNSCNININIKPTGSQRRRKSKQHHQSRP